MHPPQYSAGNELALPAINAFKEHSVGKALTISSTPQATAGLVGSRIGILVMEPLRRSLVRHALGSEASSCACDGVQSSGDCLVAALAALSARLRAATLRWHH